MKICNKCHEELPLTEFYKSQKDGLQTYCKSCSKERIRAHYQNNKQYYVDKAKVSKAASRDRYIAYKESMPCTDCGLFFPSYVTQFDHIGSDKAFNVANKVFGNWEKLLEEIQKCELVCANCHAVRTWQRRQDSIPQ